MLAFAEEGSGPLVVATTLANGLGEEVFFRGAMYAALDADRAVAGVHRPSTRWPPWPPATRRWCWPPAFMGTLFALQRRASGGLQAPMLTHLTWSTLMVRYLPPLFRHAHRSLP